MKQIKKSWIWKLSIFASNNYTTIGETIYYPNYPAKGRILQHELIHVQQFKDTGTLKFIFLYLFCFPFFYNPWRYKWEMEAYLEGSGISESYARKILGSKQYGWLREVEG